MKLTSNEISAIVLASLVLGFVFGFDDKSGTLIFIHWIANFITQSIVAAIALLLFIIVTKWYAKKNCVNATFEIWQVKFKKLWKNREIPVGFILPLLITILSNGVLLFAAVVTPTYKHTKTARFGKKFEIPSEKELANISVIGPLTLTIIAAIITAGIGTTPLTPILFAIAFSTMLPLPRLQGCYVYFGSPTLYVFSMAIIIGSFFLVQTVNFSQAIILTVLIAVTAMIAYHLQQFIAK